MVVLPALVDTDRVACPPSFSTLLKIFNKLASSSPIFSSQNLEKKNGRGRKSSSLLQGQLLSFLQGQVPMVTLVTMINMESLMIMAMMNR